MSSLKLRDERRDGANVSPHTSASSVLRPEKVSERSTSAASTAAAMRSCARWMRRADDLLWMPSGPTAWPCDGDGVDAIESSGAPPGSADALIHWFVPGLLPQDCIAC